MGKKAIKTEEKKKQRRIQNITLDPNEFPKEEPKICEEFFAEPSGSKKLTIRQKKHLNPIPLFVIKDIGLSLTSVGLLTTNNCLPTAAVHTEIILFISFSFTIAAALIGLDLLGKHLAER